MEKKEKEKGMEHAEAGCPNYAITICPYLYRCNLMEYI